MATVIKLPACILVWTLKNSFRIETVKNDRLLKIGTIGAAVAALCCFTPVLVLLLGALGLSSLTGVLDYVLFPALGVFALMTIFALKRRAQP